jgi:AcrR family transcriptional regulator
VSPRHYKSDRRKAAADETRRKIVQSTVDLHAAHGVVATSYAMIAKDADVAVPTVYNHFPTRGDLLVACTGQAAAAAPPLGPEIYAGLKSTDARLQALARALSTYYQYYAPWMRWAVAETQQVPEMAALVEAGASACKQLVEMALEPAFDAAPPPELVALCEVLVSFPAWQRLSAEPSDCETALSDALTTLTRSHLSQDKRTL